MAGDNTQPCAGYGAAVHALCVRYARAMRALCARYACLYARYARWGRSASQLASRPTARPTRSQQGANKKPTRSQEGQQGTIMFLRWSGSRFLYGIVSIDYACILCGLRELHEPNQYMNSAEMMLPYTGQKVDSYIVSIDSAQIFCGLRKLHDPNCIWHPVE